jgi:two-component system OmpR family response regulator
MARAPSVLIVDDDPHIREVVRFALRREGFETLEASDGTEALRVFDAHGPTLIVLDILMPEMDGTEVARELRSRSSVPIVFLSSKDDEIDRIVGLELGGDDYVTKPFSPRELVARVRAVLRRLDPDRRDPPQSGSRETKGKLKHGKLVLDLDRFQTTWENHQIALTATEFGLLQALMTFPGKVYTREDLMRHAYPDGNIVSDRTIDSHVRRIRKKFADVGGEPIETALGLGYKLGECR